MKKNSKKTLIISIVGLLLMLLIISILEISSLLKKQKIPVTKNSTVYYKNANPIILEDIVEKNTKNKKTEKIIVEEMDLDYKTLYKENNNMPEGVFRVIQLGEDGNQNVVLKQTFENEELISENLVANNVLKNSVEKIIEIGTGKGFLNAEIEKNDTVYVCANNLKLKQEMDTNSMSLGILNYNVELEILDVFDNWFEVEVDGIHGYIVKEGVSKYNPDKDYNVATGSNQDFSKEELLSNLSFDMDVSVQSGLSLDQFEAIFENNPYDTNDVMKNNAKYFYYAEEQYNINGVFLAAIAVHESAWGTSSIARNKNNLFGYCAYDSNPYDSASNFATPAEGIDLVARVLMKNYLNTSGTVLADGSVASGRYYSGKTIQSVNVHYATDKNWANCVYTWMEKLYNSIP